VTEHNELEKIIIVGAGMAGLACALALSGPRRQIFILEKDAAPTGLTAEDAFQTWERNGVAQMRHSHVFLGRLFSLIRDRHPHLLQQLLAAGAREWRIADSLPPALRGRYVARSGDEDLTILFSRRTTLEWVLRRAVEALPGVSVRTGIVVRAPLTSVPDAGLTVKGVRIECGGVSEDLCANTVIDASGRNSIMAGELRARGAHITDEEAPTGILYFSRHFRLRDGQSEPERGAIPSAGDLSYIKYGVFAADNRHFSVTLCVPEIELALRTAIPHPEIFDAVCMALPGVARWTAAERSEPAGKVYAMGNLRNLWREFTDAQGKPSVLGYFAVGDAVIRTNPLYGRGCTQAFVAAHALARILDAGGSQQSQARAYAAALRRELRPHWKSIAHQDRGAIKRARNAQNPNRAPSLKGRWVKSFVEDAVEPAARGDLRVFRAFMRGFHLMKSPTQWLRNPLIMARILWFWLQSKSRKQQFYAPPLGPSRIEMLKQLPLGGLRNAA
jgi:2-polyprenyl-6-methoxyphenol hydroxylase-like FAD-dependent oxidoreductase